MNTKELRWALNELDEKIKWVGNTFDSKWKEMEMLFKISQDAIRYVLADEKRKTWRYVDVDGNPTVPGEYHVTLMCNGWDNEKQEPNDEVFFELDTRSFEEYDVQSNWIMKDQPTYGLVWYEQAGSYPNERVLAWKPVEKVEMADIPEDLKVLTGDDEE